MKNQPKIRPMRLFKGAFLAFLSGKSQISRGFPNPDSGAGRRIGAGQKLGTMVLPSGELREKKRVLRSSALRRCSRTKSAASPIFPASRRSRMARCSWLWLIRRPRSTSARYSIRRRSRFWRCSASRNQGFPEHRTMVSWTSEPVLNNRVGENFQMPPSSSACSCSRLRSNASLSTAKVGSRMGGGLDDRTEAVAHLIGFRGGQDRQEPPAISGLRFDPPLARHAQQHFLQLAARQLVVAQKLGLGDLVGQEASQAILGDTEIGLLFPRFQGRQIELFEILGRHRGEIAAIGLRDDDAVAFERPQRLLDRLAGHQEGVRKFLGAEVPAFLDAVFAEILDDLVHDLLSQRAQPVFAILCLRSRHPALPSDVVAPFNREWFQTINIPLILNRTMFHSLPCRTMARSMRGRMPPWQMEAISSVVSARHRAATLRIIPSARSIVTSTPPPRPQSVPGHRDPENLGAVQGIAKSGRNLDWKDAHAN